MRPSVLSPLFLLLLTACGEDSKPDDTETEPTETGPDTWAEFVDADGDGITEADGDCDDEDPEVFPGNVESCNGTDDNCNGMTDEGWPDTDGDGTADCLDAEECDGVDNDGDGEIDEDFSDTDGDGVADCMEVEVCDGADNDGDGEIDEGFDVDADGYTSCGSEELPADCDDDDALINPGADELDEDLTDNDCDGMIDELGWAQGDLVITEIMANPQAVSDPRGEWFELINMAEEVRYLNGMAVVLASGDEHLLVSEELLAVEPGEYFLIGNNADVETNGRVELDYAIDGLLLGNESDSITLWTTELEIEARSWDDGASMPDTAGASMSLDAQAFDLGLYDAENWCASQTAWVFRSDYGTPGMPNDLCPNFDHDGDGYSFDSGDCDDDDPAIFPGAEDFWYDGVDQDCDGWSDFDADLDGFDAAMYGGDDCDDADDEINPDATEICDDGDIDEDCNGLADNADSGATGTTTWYTDTDLDGFGTGAGTDYCDPPPRSSLTDGDCDDANDAAHPGATEVWYNGVDEDCDGANDYDADGDGYESDAHGGTDCDDEDATVYPMDYYPDDDGDGFGDEYAAATSTCEPPSGYVTDNTDCDDANPAVHLCQVSWEIASSASSQATGSSGFRGNSYAADADDTLVSFEQYLALSSSCDLDFYVLEQVSGVWSVAWYDQITAPAGTGYVSSGDIDLAVTMGNNYMLGVGFTCSTTYYWESGSWSGTDTGIGTFRNPHFATSYSGYSATYYPPNTGASTQAYTQIVTMATEY